MIKLAKNNFYTKKFNSVQGYLKKNMGLINELREKVEQSIKAWFIINGELVEDRRKISNEFNSFYVKTCSSTLNAGNDNDNFRSYMNKRVQTCI